MTAFYVPVVVGFVVRVEAASSWDAASEASRRARAVECPDILDPDPEVLYLGNPQTEEYTEREDVSVVTPDQKMLAMYVNMRKTVNCDTSHHPRF